MKAYWALVHGKGREFGISFPDVPGCISAGTSLEEVLAEGSEALSAHLALLKADCDPIPEPRSHAELAADPDADWNEEDAAWHLVPTREVAAPRLRVNVMVDPTVLREADAAAAAIGQTRSGFIEDALRERLALAAGRTDQVRQSRARARRSA